MARKTSLRYPYAGHEVSHVKLDMSQVLEKKTTTAAAAAAVVFTCCEYRRGVGSWFLCSVKE